MNKLKSIAMGIGFAAVTIMVIHDELRSRYWAHAEQSWLEVNAKIDAATLFSTYSRRSGTHWFTVWTYSYLVDDIHYQTSSRAIEGAYVVNQYSDRKDAEEERAQRPKGSWAIAYYDPKNPGRSVLDRLTPSETPTLVIVLAIASAIGALIFIGIPIYHFVDNR